MADKQPNNEGLFLTTDEHGSFLVFIVRWMYNVILALIFAVAVVVFYATIAVLIAIMIQLAISFIVGISNPIPFNEYF